MIVQRAARPLLAGEPPAIRLCSKPANAGGKHKAWGGATGRGTPGTLVIKHKPTKLGASSSTSAARLRRLQFHPAFYLGLHPRLYAGRPLCGLMIWKLMMVFVLIESNLQRYKNGIDQALRSAKPVATMAGLRYTADVTLQKVS